MIFSYGARNYFSFKDGFEISLEFNSKVPKTISRSKKASNILGIKGANASGKTNVLKCLRFLGWFTTQSFKYDPEKNIYLEGYFSSTKPSDFYVDFEQNGIKYRYELSTTKKAVVREAIYKKISRRTMILERKLNEISYATAELSDVNVITLRNNASIIDTIEHYKLRNIGEDLSNIYSFFKSIKGNVHGLGFVEDSTLYNHNTVSKFYFNQPAALEFATEIIRSADLGISKIVIHESTGEDGELRYFPIFHHDIEIDSEIDSDIDKTENWLTYWEESDGTCALYRRLHTYWRVLQAGGILVMDEFDTNLHPDLLPKLLDLFSSGTSNPNDAQFIFTSHNLEIMDYLGKYRNYLVSKEKGESFCYRLDEIPGDIIRNDRSISALYRDGKLGGVPKI